jgi:hypothetical protein
MSKKHVSQAGLLLVTLVFTLLAACYGAYGGTEVGLEVNGPPPELRSEVAIDSPGDGYVWVPGYWDWGTGGDWAWVGGAWQRPPHEHAVWVAPEYKNRRGHWHYRHGYWK